MKMNDDPSPQVLEDLFLTELEEMYDAEHRIAKLLSMTVESASCWSLKKAVLAHSLETESHVMKLERVFHFFGKQATGITSSITLGLVDEGMRIAAGFGGSPAINAALISLLHKVEHYEIAAYSSLREWAILLGSHDAVDLLEEILEDESAADERWVELARSTCNEEALGDIGHEDFNSNISAAG